MSVAAVESTLIESAGRVEYRASGNTDWLAATNGLTLAVGDRVRTGDKSRAAVQFSDRSVLRLNERTTLEIQPPRRAEERRFRLWQGILYFFNREQPARLEFETPVVSGAIRGTEFALEADEATGATRLALLEGEVDLAAAGGNLALKAGEQAEVKPGQAPVKSPLIDAASAVQWALYYPAVVAPADLGLTASEAAALAASLDAYRAGDFLEAHRRASEEAASEGGKLYRAALDLTVGQVEAAEGRLRGTPDDHPARKALQELIAVVRGNPTPQASAPGSPSEWLARSYGDQSRFQLRAALAAADRAVAAAPEFGAARARQAELLLMFDRRQEALAALDTALAQSPRLASAHAIRGFALLDRQDTREALAAFDEAIRIEAGLGSAWLGRGLAQLRLRQRDEGLKSLQTAAALEPRRALHRSYLAKAFSERGEPTLAEKEFQQAQSLDPNDPTAWLYSSLHRWRQLRPNAAVEDLEKSAALNDRRGLFRSRLLLDRDLAVRSANLASIYRDAGLPEAGLRAAAQAVAEDYANFSGHLFLANSYRQFEDPTRFDLRYESVRQSELLVANLLAPPGAGNLSQLALQQEHLRLFDPRALGVSTYTEYRSNGDWHQEASLFGSVGKFSYALDASLDWQNGQSGYDWLERREVSLQVKQAVSSQDEIYFQAGYMEGEAGDIARRYDPATGNRGFRVEHEQLPNLQVGWHRAWSPGHHTLLLLSRWSDDLRLHDPQAGIPFLRQIGGTTTSVSTPPLFDWNLASEFTLYSGELQHIWQTENHALIAGVRGQFGEVEPDSLLSRALTGVVANDRFDESLDRQTAYAYYHWQVAPSLKLVAGLSYDRLSYPVNTELPPISQGDRSRDLIAPKAGLLYTPWRDGLFRASYAQSLGGVFFDNSIRLEPTHLAGFNQTYRSLLPESAAGLVPGTKFETIQAGFDQSWPTRTYFGLEAQHLRSDGGRTVGVLTNSLPLPVPDSASSTFQTLEYRERGLSTYLVQLLGDGLSLGLRYRVSEAELTGRFPNIPDTATGLAGLEQDERAVFHEASFTLNYQHTSGFFAQWESVWHLQENDGYTPPLAGDEFWQHHVFVGWRWPNRRAEVRVGVLNLNDADYRLNPLSLYRGLVRERTAVASLRLNF